MKFLLQYLLVLAALMAGCLVLAACGGEGKDEAPTPAAATEAEKEEQATPTSTATPSDTSPAVPPLCPDPQPPFVTDLDVRQTPSLDEPQARVPFRDPVFGTCLVRVTDRWADVGPDDIPSDELPGLTNIYSRVQSFNADGSQLLLLGSGATWYLYDADTLQPLGKHLSIVEDPRWDAADPDLLYYSDGTRLMAYTVATGEQSLVREFADDFPGQALAAVWTRWEGSPSSDGRYWGLMAQDEDWETVAFLVYDQQTDRVIAKRDMRGVPEVEEGVDTVTISPLGNYFVAGFDRNCEEGQLGDDANPCGLMVYDRDLTNGRGLVPFTAHMDLALDAEGREVAFGGVGPPDDPDHISMLDLATGTVTPLWNIDYTRSPDHGHHYSGRALQRPGWGLVSTEGHDPEAYIWMDHQVFAVELKPDGRVVRLAHTHSLQGEDWELGYWAQPRASVNPDFTRIIFTSNWGQTDTEEKEVYMIELPPDWPEQLP